MKILVTGGAGFIGSHTCDRLLSLGHEVTVLDALTPPVHRDGHPPGMRPESALPASHWDIPCPQCGGPLEMRTTPERVSNPQNAYGMSKLGEEMVAVNLGRRYGIPTVALRYSIVQGPRQSVYNAYSGACRIFCLSYLQGIPPVLYEDGGAIRDYVNINNVVDADVLVLQDDR